MSDLNASIDIGGAVKLLTEARKAVLQAEAQACNATAKDVQQATVKTLLPSKFTLRARGNPWQRPGTKFGFNVKFASAKTDVIQAAVGSQADWLTLQEKGGTKSRSGKNLAIVSDARKSPTAVLAAKDKPRRLLQSAGETIKARVVKTQGSGFKLKLKSGKEGIYVRTSTDSLRLMYVLQPTAKIKPALGFEVFGRRIVNQQFEPNFNAAFLRLLPRATNLAPIS